ncbi:META domain-containing protein [Spirulina subsalsa FACHB-351]|uniref:META domain-containing protein n=1 Tax=Spirulina subsalsa FACHB-351 TaxID=234711 RepID=A0ABT3L9G8_9CYAN|nr:META domain-containing protein [Spirulina subsalsa]MCW6038158.1 META domain-containing protein [Spirulina subsalsa FACHB-351]
MNRFKIFLGFSLILIGVGLTLNIVELRGGAEEPTGEEVNEEQILEPSPSVPDISLPGTTWRLILWGTPTELKRPLNRTEITANFTRNKITGSGSCNQYNTSYREENNRLTVSPVASTRKACSIDIMQQETAYLRALEGAESYAITDQRELRISFKTDEGVGVMIFTPQAIPAL